MTKMLLLSCSALLLATNNAAAFNLGFIRAPDWMDQYFAWMIAAQILLIIGVFLTKPIGVPFNQLRTVKLDPAPKFFFYSFGTLYMTFMLLIFIGMGLARYAEF